MSEEYIVEIDAKDIIACLSRTDLTPEEQNETILNMYKGNIQPSNNEDINKIIKKTIVMKNAHLLHDQSLSVDEIKAKVLETAKKDAGKTGCSIDVSFE